jgi:hypothetical protein
MEREFWQVLSITLGIVGLTIAAFIFTALTFAS